LPSNGNHSNNERKEGKEDGLVKVEEGVVRNESLVGESAYCTDQIANLATRI
jgi:hypothetical protein